MSQSIDPQSDRCAILSDSCHIETTLAAVEAGLKDKSHDWLLLLRDMVEADYGGCTFKNYQKYPPAIALCCCGAEGINLLADLCIETARYSTRAAGMATLIHIAGGTDDYLVKHYLSRSNSLGLIVSGAQFDRVAAERECARVVLNIDTDEELPSSLFNLFNQLDLSSLLSDCSRNAAAVLFGSMLPRWFRLNDAGISEFCAAINDAVYEEDIHVFLAAHPHLIDPFIARAWSKPRLGESLQADFLIERVDGSYLVVEIEKPSDRLMTSKGNLSAKATEAVRQALEYRDWLIQNRAYTSQLFPGMRNPQALAVVGLENNLTEAQLSRLDTENSSRGGSVQVIGFDRLVTRARSIMDNLLTRSTAPRVAINLDNNHGPEAV
ncbi:MAG: Shedu anti-phage system protein SduA domain-containing protein [Planctomycetota bacterium]